MKFTLANVHHGAKVYLESERNRYIMESLDIEPDYIWDDEHWNDIDHYYISKYGDLFTVAECIGGEIIEIKSDLTQEQVVTLINKMCELNGIIYIK